MHRRLLVLRSYEIRRNTTKQDNAIVCAQQANRKMQNMQHEILCAFRTQNRQKSEVRGAETYQFDSGSLLLDVSLFVDCDLVTVAGARPRLFGSSGGHLASFTQLAPFFWACPTPDLCESPRLRSRALDGAIFPGPPPCLAIRFRVGPCGTPAALPPGTLERTPGPAARAPGLRSQSPRHRRSARLRWQVTLTPAGCPGASLRRHRPMETQPDCARVPRCAGPVAQLAASGRSGRDCRPQPCVLTGPAPARPTLASARLD